MVLESQHKYFFQMFYGNEHNSYSRITFYSSVLNFHIDLETKCKYDKQRKSLNKLEKTWYFSTFMYYYISWQLWFYCSFPSLLSYVLTRWYENVGKLCNMSNLFFNLNISFVRWDSRCLRLSGVRAPTPTKKIPHTGNTNSLDRCG